MASAHSSQYSYLHERARHARSREEHDHYLRELRALEMRDEMHHIEMMKTQASMSTPMLGEMPKQVKEEITPLSFLKSADKKLLLTGATT
jgi:hypothetical protein